MDNRTMKSIAAGVLVPLALLVPMTGCSDSTEDQAVIEGPETTDSGTTGSDATSPQDGEEVVAPVIVEDDQPVTIETGRMIDVTSDGVTEVATSDDSVLEVTQPRDDGSAQFNAGATAKAPGVATLSVYAGDELLYEVEVTVES